MPNPKRRMIDPSFWMSETIATLSIQNRYLFIGLFSNADDQGRLRGHPALIRNLVYPYDAPDIEDIESGLKAIEDIGSIIIYEIDGKVYIQITKWWDYQHPQWAYPSEIPAPDGWNDRLRYRESNRIKTYNWHGTLDNVDFEDEQDADETPDDEQGNALPEKIANSLPKALANPLPIATVIEVEIELVKDDDERARVKTAVINWLYQNHVEQLPAQSTCQQINAPPYADLPILWWIEAILVACDNNVRKWSYVKGVLNRSIQAKKSPNELGSPKPKRSQNGRKPISRAAAQESDELGQALAEQFKVKGG